MSVIGMVNTNRFIVNKNIQIFVKASSHQETNSQIVKCIINPYSRKQIPFHLSSTFREVFEISDKQGFKITSSAGNVYLLGFRRSI